MPDNEFGTLKGFLTAIPIVSFVFIRYIRSISPMSYSALISDIIIRNWSKRINRLEKQNVLQKFSTSFSISWKTPSLIQLFHYPELLGLDLVQKKRFHL